MIARYEKKKKVKGEKKETVKESKRAKSCLPNISIHPIASIIAMIVIIHY